MWEWRYSSATLYVVSSQLQASVPLLRGKKSAEWALELMWTLWRRETSLLLLPGIELQFPAQVRSMSLYRLCLITRKTYLTMT
jgi:hypothetical protein